MKTIAIAVFIGLVAAFFTLTSGVTGLPSVMIRSVIVLSLVIFIASAVLTSYNKSARWGVAVGLSLPAVLVLVYMVVVVLSEGRGLTWQLLMLACSLLIGAFGGALLTASNLWPRN